MKLSKFDATNLRGFHRAAIEFDPRFTLLVGVNGVGKSTLLEALRICLSKVLPKFTSSRSRADAFSSTDIRIGSPNLVVDLDFHFDDGRRNLLIQKNRESHIKGEEGSVRSGTIDTPDLEKLTPQKWELVSKSDSQPLAVYFGTRRSHPSDERPKTGSSGGQSSAYSDALSTSRPLLLADIAAWMLAQESLAKERPRSAKQLKALKQAAASFLPTCTGLRAEMDRDKPRLLIAKNEIELDVRHLSEGERGMLALALDLARRLAQANPGLDDPVSEGSAIVLIDELDMHMHPKWQRKVISLLTVTFKNCQFIATTHSPQMIGETQPQQIILLKSVEVAGDTPRVEVETCGQAYGLDTNYVLEQVMGTASRSIPVSDAIEAVEEALDDGDLENARKHLDHLRQLQHGDDPTSVGLEAEINNLDALSNEAD